MNFLKKIFNFSNKKIEEETKIKEEDNNDEDDNFTIEFEDPPIENENKYNLKNKKPHYWTEQIDTSKLREKEKNNKEIIIQAEIIKPKNKKKNYHRLKQEWIKKGKEYEKFVGKYFENQGYIVKYNGIENGKKDNSIDIIAIKQNEIILIQCKNWKEDGKYKITHKDIKAFVGDTYTFISENSQYKNYNIKRLFVISGKILDKSAYAYIKEHQNEIKYLLLKMEDN